MSSYATFVVLAAAGAALVIQNLIMVRITEQVPSVLITLAINSAVGLVLLTTLLMVRMGPAGILQAVTFLQPGALIPGLLGSFFVFASIMGYQRVGAATTISVLVASQLISGLISDAIRANTTESRPEFLAILGTILLVVGAYLVARQRV